MDIKTQNTVAVVIGLLTATIVGIALIPVMKILLTNSITYSFQHGLRINNFAVYGYGFLWNIICAFIGGFITCWIAVERKIFHSLLTGIFGCAILLIGAWTTGRTNLAGDLTALAFIPLTLIGGIVRRIIENKRADQNL